MSLQSLEIQILLAYGSLEIVIGVKKFESILLLKHDLAICYIIVISRIWASAIATRIFI
jgi:hypothetical protein